MPKEKYIMTPAEAVNVVRTVICDPDPWAKVDRTDIAVALAVLSRIASEYDGFECHDPLEETESGKPLTIEDMAKSARYWRSKAASLYNVARLSRVRAAILDALRGSITITNPADKVAWAPVMRKDDSISMMLCAASDAEAFSIIDAWLHDGDCHVAETEMIHLHAMLSTAMIAHKLSPHDSHGGIDVSIPGFGPEMPDELCVVKGSPLGSVTIWEALTKEEAATFGHECATTAEDAFLRIIAKLENPKKKYIPDDYATRYADRRKPWERKKEDLVKGTVPSDEIPSVGDEDDDGIISRAKYAGATVSPDSPTLALYPAGVSITRDGKEYVSTLSMRTGGVTGSIGWDTVMTAPPALAVSAEDRASMEEKLACTIEEAKSSAADEGRRAAVEEIAKFFGRYGKIMDMLDGMGGGGYGE